MRPTKHVPVVSSARRDARWRAVVADHAVAVETFAAAALTVPADAWARRPAPEAWSPGEIVMHLVLASEAALRELAGGPAMAPRVAWWMQPLVRWTVLPRILRGRGFPSGVRAPRETRPGRAPLDRAEAIALFRQRAEELERAIEAARARNGRAVLTHPHFGRLGLYKAVGLMAEHVRHHQLQLERVRDALRSSTALPD